jgi:hypothetical protein
MRGHHYIVRPAMLLVVMNRVNAADRDFITRLIVLLTWSGLPHMAPHKSDFQVRGKLGEEEDFSTLGPPTNVLAACIGVN